MVSSLQENARNTLKTDKVKEQSRSVHHSTFICVALAELSRAFAFGKVSQLYQSPAHQLNGRILQLSVMLLGKNPNFTFSVHIYHNSYLVARVSLFG